MFELPDAKRVRREDLGSDSEDEAPGRDEGQDAELLAKLHARMAGMLDLGGLEQPASTPPKKTKAKHVPPTTKTKTTKTTSSDNDEEDAEMVEAAAAEPEEFEFRLFSTAPATKIALVDEDEIALEGEGGMVRERPLSYYIAAEPTPEARAAFAEAAVSGEDVLERAKQRWWGTEMPWRVTTVATEARKGGASKGDGESGDAAAAAAAARRRRPGKKKRIALRMKERDRKKQAEEEEKAKMGKEEALKEKKKRINRLKKLRKRKKDKEAKQAGGGGAAAAADADDSGEGSEGDDE